MSNLPTSSPAKNPIVSKTNILGALQILVAVLALVSASPLFAEYTEWILLFSGILTIVLRFLTTSPISFEAPVRVKDVIDR